MASARPAEVAAYTGAGLLVLSSVALAASGPELVAAATWLRDAGDAVPRWLLGPFGDGFGLGGAGFYALLWVAMVGYLAVVLGASYLGLRGVWLLGAFCLAAFTIAPPLLSQDIFSYIAYARIGTEAGLNPYEHPPTAISGDPVFPLVGWPDTVSVYGPVFSLLSYAVAPLSLAAGTWTIKVAMAGSVGLAGWICARIAAWRGSEPAAVLALVILNPLVLVHVVGGGHNDALIGLAVAASIALVLSAREAAGAAAIIVAAAIKASGLFIAPFALLGAHQRVRFVAGTLAALGVVALISLVAFGPSAIEAAAVLDSNQDATSRYSVPATVARAFSADPDTVRYLFLALFAITIGGLLAWTWRGGDWVRAAGWAGMMMLIASGWLLPWYVIWILPAVALSRDRPLIALAFVFTAFQLINRIPL